VPVTRFATTATGVPKFPFRKFLGRKRVVRFVTVVALVVLVGFLLVRFVGFLFIRLFG